MLKFWLFLCGLFASLTFFNQSANAVVFGSYVEDPTSESPWVVSIWLSSNQNSSPKFICSGTLISPQIVVSAAHCFQGLKGSDFYVESGAAVLGKGKLTPVDSYWVSPRYSSRSIINDVAVAHLLLPIKLPNYPNLDTSMKSDSNLSATSIIYGWGKDQNGEVTGDLRKASLKFQTGAALRAYGKFFNTKTNIAAGAFIPKEKVYAAACNGDSGGPLFRKTGKTLTLIGVVSYGPAEDCNYKVPTVYSRVAYYQKDFKTALDYVNKRAKTVNIAAPINLKAPMISGEPSDGAELNCNKGDWTDNAKDFGIAWFSSDKSDEKSLPANLFNKDWEAGNNRTNGPLYKLRRDVFSKYIYCVVRAKSDTKISYALTSFKLPDLGPNVVFTTPADNVTVAGEFQLRAQITPGTGEDSRIAKVCLLRNGSRFAPRYFNGNNFSMDADGCIEDNSSSLQWSFDTTAWTNGSYSFTLKATDSNGRVSNIASRTLIVSNSNPVVEFTTPSEGSTTTGEFNLKATATPAISGTARIAKVCLLRNGSRFAPRYFNGNNFSMDADGCIEDNSSSLQWSFDTTAWTNGSYSFTLKATDSNGRVSNIASRTLIVSNSNPVVEFTTPSEGSTTTGEFNLKATATPAISGTARIAKVCLLRNGSRFQPRYYNGNNFTMDADGCIEDNSSSLYWSFDTTAWTNGSYSFTLKATDSNGRVSNIASRTLIVSNSKP